MTSKFEHFWTKLNQCPYDLPAEIKPFLQQAIEAAGFYETQTVTVSTGGGGSTKTKKLSGYNLYMREKMAELKVQNVPSGERMTKVSQMWKALKEEEKGTWKTKAGALMPAGSTSSVKESKTGGPKKLSGYQLYVRETMAVVKAKPEIAAKERMAEIGKMWKALKDDEKANWKTKAEKL